MAPLYALVMSEQRPSKKRKTRSAFHGRIMDSVAARDAERAAVIAGEAVATAALSEIPLAELHTLLYTLCAEDGRAVERAEVVRCVFEELRSRRVLKEAAISLMVRFLVRVPAVDEALALLHWTEEHSILLKLRSFSPVLEVYAQSGNASGSIAVLDWSTRLGIPIAEQEYALTMEACVREGISSNNVFERVYVLLHDDFPALTKASRQILERWFSLSGFSFHEAAVDTVGTCSFCGSLLDPIEIPEEERIGIMSRINTMVLERSNKEDEWKQCVKSMKERSYDVVIDGANVGFFENRPNSAADLIDFAKVDRIVQYYCDRSKKVLVVLHERHLQARHADKDTDSLIRAWEHKGQLQLCSKGLNDDWLWMYAAFCKSPDVLYVSNDECRDHHFKMLSNRGFYRWKERHRVTFSFNENKQPVLCPPSIYSLCTQRTPSSIHIPCTEDESWVCGQRH